MTPSTAQREPLSAGRVDLFTRATKPPVRATTLCRANGPKSTKLHHVRPDHLRHVSVSVISRVDSVHAVSPDPACGRKLLVDS
jgi:hypothetical protein